MPFASAECRIAIDYGLALGLRLRPRLRRESRNVPREPSRRTPGFRPMRPLLTSSESVRANWPAEMSHSPHGECDFECQGTDEFPGSKQPARRAHDAGSGSHADGSEPAPHPAHTGGLPGKRLCISCPWPPWPQAGQRYSRSDQEQGGSPGSHGVRGSQPHPSRRVAQ